MSRPAYFRKSRPARAGRDLSLCFPLVRRGRLISNGPDWQGLEGRTAMMYGYGYGSGWPFWADALMWLGMIALLGLLIWAVRAFAGSASRRRSDASGARASGPGQILDERLARGEIDAGEYARLRETLASGSPQRPADSGSRN
jgi:putative membrane protein